MTYHKKKNLLYYISLLFLSLTPTIILLLFLEVLCYGIYTWYIEPTLAYDHVVHFEPSPSIFRKETLNTPTGTKDVFFAPYFPTPYYRGEKESRGKYIQQKKTKNTYRIFTYGGSSTAGSPFGHWGSFSRHIQESLNRVKKKGTTVEVMNFGVSGAGSGRVSTLVRQTLTYEPDLIVVYTGHNEYDDNYHILRNNALKNALKETTHAKLIEVLKKFYFWRCAQHLLGTMKSVSIPERPFRSVVPTRIKKLVPMREEHHELFHNNYRFNIKTIVEEAKKTGTEVLLLSEIANHLIPPTSYGGFPTSALEMALIDAYRRGTRRDIEALIEELRRRESNNAHAYFYEGLLNLEKGDSQLAESLFEQAILFDRLSRRFRKDYKKILFNAAEKNNHTTYVDINELVKQKLGDRIIDGRVIMDVMHPTLLGQAYIAEIILERYFLKHKPKSELLHYSKLSAKDIYSNKLELLRYQNICKRYYSTKDWGECLAKAVHSYHTAQSRHKKMRNRRSWENAYFYNLCHSDSSDATSYRAIINDIPHLPWRLSAENCVRREST